MSGETTEPNKENDMRILAIVLIILGVLGLLFQGFTYVAPEKVAEFGPVKVFADKEKTVWIPPVVGGVAIVSGVALLALSARKRTT
jgi:uncharacterized membrane protein HdeD (DUF308 family)